MKYLIIFLFLAGCYQVDDMSVDYYSDTDSEYADTDSQSDDGHITLCYDDGTCVTRPIYRQPDGEYIIGDE